MCVSFRGQRTRQSFSPGAVGSTQLSATSEIKVLGLSAAIGKGVMFLRCCFVDSETAATWPAPVSFFRFFFFDFVFVLPSVVHDMRSRVILSVAQGALAGLMLQKACTTKLAFVSEPC